MTDAPTADDVLKASETLCQEIAATAQMNFMFGIALVSAKILIKTNPEAKESYARLIDNVTEVLRHRARTELTNILADATAAGPAISNEVGPVIHEDLEELCGFIGQVAEQYRQELFGEGTIGTPTAASDP